MHRFFVEKENISSNIVVLKDSDTSHIRKVLRLKVGDQVEVLVKALHQKKMTHPGLERKPILLKISPDLDEEQQRDIALMSLASGIDGLIISNSTVDRPSKLISRNKNEVGGLSGKPLFIKSTLMLKKM